MPYEVGFFLFRGSSLLVTLNEKITECFLSLNTSSLVLGVKILMFYLSKMRVIASICLVLLSFYASGQAKRAQNLFDKDKVEDAVELLRKTIAKDSLASAEKYMLADYLFEPDSIQYDLDSAYYYILAAQNDFIGLEEKEQSKLIDDGFTPARYSSLKEDVELAAFERAKGQGKVTDFNAFMNDFATSNLIDSAIYYRNNRA
jgi:uncharacterized membrane protein